MRPLVTADQSAVGAAMLAGRRPGARRGGDGEELGRYGELDRAERIGARCLGRLLPIFRAGYRKHVDDFAMLAQLT